MVINQVSPVANREISLPQRQKVEGREDRELRKTDQERAPAAKDEGQLAEGAREAEKNVNKLDLGDTVIFFEVDEELDRVVVKVVDKESGDVVKEIPPEELRQAAVNLREAVGRLLSHFA